MDNKKKENIEENNEEKTVKKIVNVNNTNKITSIDEYINLFPFEISKILNELRSCIVKYAPNAKEAISYQMPTFKLDGKNVIHFAAYQNHIGIYPTPEAIIFLKDRLTKYKTSKGAIQFKITEPLPYDLIIDIVKHRVSVINNSFTNEKGIISNIANTEDIVKSIAIAVKNNNGKMFYVGGYVRDKIINKNKFCDLKDIDVEIFNIKPNILKDILSKYGKVNEVGKKFGIFKINGINIDFSMPRKEKNSGAGHKAFEIVVDPYMSIKDSARRRDFTINSILEDVLTGERFDYFNGLQDIKNKTIKHVDDITFIEDELRVLRACQFAARFGFKIANETLNLCKHVSMLNISKERIYGELEKALLKSNKPSIFFELAKEIGFLKDIFPPLEKLIGLKQNPIYHPEGDVWNHTMEVIDQGTSLKDRSNYPIAFMLACVCHDLGKITTTQILENGTIVSYHHEKDSEIIDYFLKNITNNKDLIDSVKLLVRNHMRPNIIANNEATDKSVRKLIVDTSGKIVNIQDAILLSKADRLGRTINGISSEELEDWWKNKLSIINEEKNIIEPIIKGRDLIGMGFKQGKEFKEILSNAFKLQIDGLDKEAILKELNLNNKKE